MMSIFLDYLKQKTNFLFEDKQLHPALCSTITQKLKKKSNEVFGTQKNNFPASVHQFQL